MQICDWNMCIYEYDGRTVTFTHALPTVSNLYETMYASIIYTAWCNATQRDATEFLYTNNVWSLRIVEYYKFYECQLHIPMYEAFLLNKVSINKFPHGHRSFCNFYWNNRVTLLSWKNVSNMALFKLLHECNWDFRSSSLKPFCSNIPFVDCRISE